MKRTLPLLLSFNGGFVDTAGFLALQGLFPAHVTGNFVTLGSSLVFGTSGVAAKLIALPAFCLVVLLVRLLGTVIGEQGVRALRVLLVIKLLLLIVAAALAIWLGPFADSDATPALITGWALIAAMAVQNALQRIHMPKAPPTNVMTSNTAQIMIDLVDALLDPPGKKRDVAWEQSRAIATTIGGFIAGCAAGAFLFDRAGTWCFVLPPVVALAAALATLKAAPPAERAAQPG